MRYNFNFRVYVLLKQASCFLALFLSFPIAIFRFITFQAICLYYITVDINSKLCLFPESSSGCLALSAAVEASLSSLILPFDITIEEAYCLFSLEAELYLNNFHFKINFVSLADFEQLIKTAFNSIFDFQDFHLKTWPLIPLYWNLHFQNFFQSQN